MQNENRYRDKYMKVYVTEKEREIIAQRAKIGGYNNTDYLRKMGLTGIIVNYDFERLQQYIYEINKIGVNINQIAKNTNETDEVSTKNMEKLNKQMDQLIDVVHESVKKI